MKRKCNPNHHHSKYCECDGKVESPNVLSRTFVCDGHEHVLINVCYRKFPGNDKWYVYFKFFRDTEWGKECVRGKMGLGAWRWNVRKYHIESGKRELYKPSPIPGEIR